ncbi:MAG: aromatic amino acid lyase [Proteobacteria bacterium]|nr:aromatic amino acid lyase [Pseudomonadota bacterium]
MTASRSIVLNKGSELPLADVVACAARADVRVSLADGAKSYMTGLRKAAEEQLAADPNRRVYGLNTGFGSNFRDYVSPERLRQLQRNLIISHCANMGAPAPRQVVRVR